MNRVSQGNLNFERELTDMADHSQGEHKHGSMDIRAQEKTFEGFVRMTVWVIVFVICVLIFMALTNA